MWINVTRFHIAPDRIADLRDSLLGPAFSFARESEDHILSFLMSEAEDPSAVRSISLWKSRAAGEAIFNGQQYQDAMTTVADWLLAPPARSGHRGHYVDIHEVPALIPPS